MKRNNKLGYVILLIVGLSCFIIVFPFKSAVERKVWFQYASAYDQARREMTTSGGAIKDFNKATKMAEKFLKARQPTETEIISVLRTPNRSFQRVGLAAMSLKPIETDQLIGILLEFLQGQDSEFRFYAIESFGKFTNFPESRKASLGTQLLDIIKSRPDNEVSILEISLLAKFPFEDVVRFLTEQLMKEGKEQLYLRYAALRALKEMGDSFYDKAAEHVNIHGSSKIKKELLEWEKSWANTPRRE